MIGHDFAKQTTTPNPSLSSKGGSASGGKRRGIAKPDPSRGIPSQTTSDSLRSGTNFESLRFKISSPIAATDPKKPHRCATHGFTLIELVVSIGIFAAIILVTMPSVKKLGDSRAVAPADHLAALLTSAARRARNGANASAWGLYLPYDPATRLTDDVILFSGNSYATRDVSQDIVFDFDDAATFDSVELSGAAPSSGDDHETVFAALTGEASLYGNVVLTFRGNTRTLIVSPSGFITVNP